MHGLVSTDCTQASLCGCTRPKRENRFMLSVAYSCVCDALPAPKHQSIAWCSLFTLPVGKRALGSTVCTQASLCGCIRPKRANHFMSHLAAYVVHCQLLGSDATWCSLFSSTGGKGVRRCMAWLAQIAHRHCRVDALDLRV